MKKLLIPFICCLVAAWSCKMEGSFYASNVQEFVTYQDGYLVNDNGVHYTLLPKQEGTDLIPLQEDQRYFALFDIENKNYQITLKDVQPVQIIMPSEYSEGDEITAHDPVLYRLNQVGKYWDMIIGYYKATNSTYNHQLSFYYKLEDSDSKLHLYVFHDGNDENPSKMEEKDLTYENKFISIPLTGAFKDVLQYEYTCDVLVKDITAGKYKVERRTF